MSSGGDNGQSGGGGEAVAPIIIKKKKGGHGHGHHGGAWKVAFADFATAMMALFLVLWLVGQSPKTKSAVGAYFRDPLGFNSGGNMDLAQGPNPGGAGLFDGGNTAVAIDTHLSARGNEAGSGDRRRDLPDLSTARDKLAQALMALRSHPWARHVELSAVEEGLRVEIQDSTEASLFAPGSIELDPAAKPVLATIADELARLPNRVVVEGHTDATPARGGRSNWELSVLRAAAARRFLVEHGMRDEQFVEVRGYADRRPRLWYDPTNPRNRRISILVLVGLEDPREPSGPPPPDHPLLRQLDRLDVAAQGPRPVREIDPAGHAQ